jgi:hypothetical protein
VPPTSASLWLPGALGARRWRKTAGPAPRLLRGAPTGASPGVGGAYREGRGGAGRAQSRRGGVRAAAAGTRAGCFSPAPHRAGKGVRGWARSAAPSSWQPGGGFGLRTSRPPRPHRGPQRTLPPEPVQSLSEDPHGPSRVPDIVLLIPWSSGSGLGAVRGTAPLPRGGGRCTLRSQCLRAWPGQG